MAAIFIRTLIVYFFLAFSLKMMGKRQIGELEVGELVSTLVVSEVAALPIADPDIPLLNAIIPIILIVCLEIIISYVKNKSEKIKKYVEGEPIFLIFRGKLLQKALADNRISVNELLCEIRMQGIDGIKDVYYAVLEPNGKLSFFDKKQNYNHTLIVDTEVNEKTLSYLGYTEAWLKNKLSEEKADISDIFLMTCDDEQTIHIIYKDGKG